ncbi:hypothetical protein [Sphingomicrobium sediminis]|uniref:Uncharacterized protein n=1 Tax=Sphingomicrobium sediminis TaxID=2950949 RepID=A0A9X2EH59_9SPHN|nr:hypothetical protein [Sphingomicrobium sediminis]MCM8557953.1 hypothetical protein [Sphingomicrobium sediminis]
MVSHLAFALALLVQDAPTYLGGDQRWAAFRTNDGRCEARGRAWRVLPDSQQERQPMMRFIFEAGENPYVHINMRRLLPTQARVMLVIDDVPFVLEGTGRNAYSGDAQAIDIMEALRSATKMRVTARDRTGTRFTDYYPLGGVPAAIDAAAAGCAD